MKMTKFGLLTLLTTSLVFTACKDDDVTPPPENEEELITTVRMVLTEVGTTTTTTVNWKDVDGPGGNAPVIDNLQLKPSKSYTCALSFLNESKNPAEDITPEIVTEASDHQIYYEPATSNVTVSNLNKDANNLPLGTTATVQTTSATSGSSFKITLKHKPGGVKAAGDLVDKGETDIEVTFPLSIQ
jgi:hypothetical protein